MEEEKKGVNWVRLIQFACVAVLLYIAFAAYYQTYSSEARRARIMADAYAKVDKSRELRREIETAKERLDEARTESERVVARRKLNGLLDEHDDLR